MHASSRKLAIALTERIGEVVPAPLTLRAEGSGVSLYADGELIGGSDAASIVDDQDSRTFSERVETAVRAVLSGVQDSILRYLRVEWPTDGEGELALPGARTEAGRVHLWYGSERQVV